MILPEWQEHTKEQNYKYPLSIHVYSNIKCTGLQKHQKTDKY